MRLTALSTYATLLAATDGAPLVRHEVGPELLAPPRQLGGAVLFLREIQTGAVGAVALGPTADVAALLSLPWQTWPGYEAIRGMTVERDNHDALVAAGARGIGEWSTMVVDEASLVRRAVPEGLKVELGIPPEEARAFVDQHYSAKWLAPAPLGETWVGLRDRDGALQATGMASVTPAGFVRLSGITVPAAARGRGLGWAVAQALTQHGFTVSDEVTLGVDDDNMAARTTYSHMGYRVSHRFSSGLISSTGNRSEGTP